MMEHRESNSVGREVSYYASFEILRGVSELARTVRFRRPEEVATTKFERVDAAESGTVPFVKYSSPYELFELAELLDPRLAAALVPAIASPRRPSITAANRSVDLTEPFALELIECDVPTASESIECDLGDMIEPGDTDELLACDLIAIDATEPLAGDTFRSDEPLAGETWSMNAINAGDMVVPPVARNLVAAQARTEARHETELVGDRRPGVAARFIVLAFLLLAGAFALGVGIPFLVA